MPWFRQPQCSPCPESDGFSANAVNALIQTDPVLSMLWFRQLHCPPCPDSDDFSANAVNALIQTANVLSAF
jgi:hypothetical protein